MHQVRHEKGISLLQKRPRSPLLPVRCRGWILGLTGPSSQTGRSSHEVLAAAILPLAKGVSPKPLGAAGQSPPPRQHWGVPAPSVSSPVVGPDGVEDVLHPVLLADALLVVLDDVGQVLDVTCREKV